MTEVGSVIFFFHPSKLAVPLTLQPEVRVKVGGSTVTPSPPAREKLRSTRLQGRQSGSRPLPPCEGLP